MPRARCNFFSNCRTNNLADRQLGVPRHLRYDDNINKLPFAQISAEAMITFANIGREKIIAGPVSEHREFLAEA